MLSSLVFLSLGFTAQLSQLVVMRELLVPFQGSEIAIALILGAWLFWTAVGSFLAHRFCPTSGTSDARLDAWRIWFALVSVLVCIAMPAAVLGIRLLRPLCSVMPGEVLPLSQLIAAAFALLAPLGICLGAQFVLASRVLRDASAVYVSESIGSAVAGFLLSLWLVPAFGAFHLVFLAGTLQLVTAMFVLPPRAGECIVPRVIVCTAAVVTAILLCCASFIDCASRAAFWHGFYPRATLVATAESAYGHLAVLVDRQQWNVYQSGRLVACLPDRGEAAPVTHLFLAQSPRPARVLLIGGGIAGMAKNILLHRVERVDYVEIDPELVALAEQFAGAADAQALHDPRLAFHAADGRAFIRSSAGGYDLIIVNVGDPDTAQINRFYTAEFFQAAKGKLAPGGVLCLGPLTTVANHQVGPVLERNACLYWTLRGVFAHVLATPGPALCLLASDGAGAPTLDAAAVLGRLEARGIKEANLFGFVDDSGILQVNYELRTGRRLNPIEAETDAPERPVRANTDLRPRAYYLGMQMWSRTVGDKTMTALLEPGRNPRTWTLAGILAVLMAVTLFACGWRRTGSARVPSVALGAFASGLSGMTIGLLVLFAFQNALGSICQAVGVVFAVFMTGLALGSASVHRLCHAGRTWSWLIALLLVTAAFLLALPRLLSVATGASTPTLQGLGFGLANLLGGALTGACYPLVVAAAQRPDEEQDWSGAFYASDLAGGCLGAFVVTVFLAPQFGCQATAVGCAVLCAAGAVILWAAGRSRRNDE